jgi:hypothetical protein
MAEGYKPFANTLSHDELDLLCEIYGKIEGERKKLLYRIIRRYGPDKLKI